VFLRYNTTTEIDFFMPDDSDPWSGKTGLSSITVQYKKQGQSAFTTLNSPTITEIGNGWYKLSVPTTLVDTYGFLVIRFSATGAKTEQHVYQVVAFNPYDSNLGLANLDAAVSSRLASSSYVAPDNTSISAIKAQTDKLTFDASNRVHSYLVAVSGGAITSSAFGAGAITSGVIADGAITAAKIATDAIAGAKIAADAVTKIAGGILQNTSNKLYTTAGGAVQVDMGQTLPTNPTTNTVGYSLKASSDVVTQSVSVRADVNSFTSNGSSALQNNVFTAVWGAQATALTGTGTIGKKVNDNLDVPVSTRLASADYSTSSIASAVWAHADRQLTSLSTGLAVSVWNVPTANVTAANSIGLRLRDNIDATISSRSTLTAAQVWSHSDRQLTALSTGLALSVWNVPTTSITAANTIGLQLKNNVDATVSSRSTLSVSDVQTALTNQGYTTARAAKLDYLDGSVTGAVSSVWGAQVTALTGDGTIGKHIVTYLDTPVSNAATPVDVSNAVASTPVVLHSSNLSTLVSAVTSGMSSQGYTTTRAQNLDNLDVAVSTRLAASSYTAPPTTGQIAIAVWSHSDRQLTAISTGLALNVWHVPATSVTAANTIGLQLKTNVDATVSSRSALTAADVTNAVWSAATGSSYGTGTFGTVIKTNLDVPVSTRLASSSYTAPPNASDIASAVWTHSSRQITDMSVNAALTVWHTPTTSVTANNTIGLQLKNNVDAAISSRSTLTTSDVQTAMTNQGYTTDRAARLDNLDVAVSSRSTLTAANVWSHSDRQLTSLSTGLALSVWHVPATSVTAANTIGLQLKTNVDAAISSRSTLSSSDVTTAVWAAASGTNYGTGSMGTLLKTNLDAPVSTRLASASYVSPPNSSDIAAAVWSHTSRQITDMSVGAALAVWHTPATSVTAANTIGLQVKTSLDTTVSSRSTLDQSGVQSAMINLGYTAARAVKLDYLDAAVSSRLASADYSTSSIAAAVWGYSTRELTAISTGVALSVWNVPTANINAANTIGLLLKTNIDATISSRSVLTTADVRSSAQQALTDQGYTTARAAKLDYLDGSVTGSTLSVWSTQVTALTGAGTIGKYIVDYLDTPVSNAATPVDVSNAVASTPVVLHSSNLSTLVSAVTSGMTSQGYTTARASRLDYLDVAVSSRLASADYTAPPTTTGIASAVWAYSDRQLTALSTGLALSVWHVPVSNITGNSTIGLQLKTNVDVATSTRLAASSYTAPDNATIGNIWSKVQNLSYTQSGGNYYVNAYTTNPGTIDYNQVAASVWSAASGTDYGANTMGTLVKTNLDATISSRLAASSYTAPPTTGQIATAVWTHSDRQLTALSTELALSVWNVPTANVTAANSIGLRLRDNIDVAVSTRLAASSYVAPPTPSDIASAVWGYTTRQITDMSANAALTVWHTPAANVTAANTIGLQLKTNVDAAISTRSTLTSGQVQTVLNNQGYTSTRAAYLDRLDVAVSTRLASADYSTSSIASAVWSYSTRELTAISTGLALSVWNVPSANVTAANSIGLRLRDNIDVAISTRLAASSYVTPPNTSDIAAAVWSYTNRQITEMSSNAALSVWHIPATSVTAANTIGLQLKSNVDAAISSRSTLTVSDVQTAMTNQGYTTDRAARLDNLDVAVSTRLAASSYTAPPTTPDIASAVWTYSTRQITDMSSAAALSVWHVPATNVTAANTIGLQVKTNLDVTVSSRSTLTSGQVQTVFDNQGYTTARAARLDNLDATISSRSTLSASQVWSHSDRQLTSLSTGLALSVWNVPSANVTASNSIGLRLRDNIDATISSRLAASNYTPPDNVTIGNIWSKVQNLSYTQSGGNYYVNAYTTNPGSVDYNQIASSVWSYSTRQLSDYSAIAPVVWGYSTRTITNATDIAGAVWSHATRTLTDMSGLAEDVWRVRRGSLGGLYTDSFGYLLDRQISSISAGGSGGGFGGPYEVTFSFVDAEDIAVGSVIFTVDGVGSAMTDGDGIITVNLPAGDYIVRAVPQQGVLFSPVSFSVTGNTIVKVRGSMRGITYASYDGTCRFVQRVVDANGQPVSGVTATMTILDLPTGVDGNRWPIGTVYTVVSDNQGKIVFPPVPAGTRVRVEIPSMNYVREMVAPSTNLMTIY
jgi:hypothetical protein